MFMMQSAGSDVPLPRDGNGDIVENGALHGLMRAARPEDRRDVEARITYL